MPESKVQNIDELLKNLDRLFDRIDTETLQFLGSEDGADTDLGSVPVDHLKDLEDLGELPRDGWAELAVSADQMEAVADIFPPTGAGKALTIDEFIFQLEKARVGYGVRDAEVKAAVLSVALDRNPIRGMVVARGILPQETLPAHWEIVASLTQRRHEAEDQPPSIDPKSHTPFVLVKQGDVLAVPVTETLGTPGWNVFGEPVPSRVQAFPTLVAGTNVAVTGQGMVAECDGSFRFDGTRLWIDSVLVLESGVGYSTGHIDFPGEVHIIGEIASGFKLKTKGSLISYRVIDATEIECGGDLVTPLGVIGRKGAIVKVEGKIRAKFVENVHLFSRGPMEVQTSALNSVLQTLDRITMGNRSLVMGGRIQALNGISVYQVGSERGSKAELVCGMDFTVLEKVNWIRDQISSLVQQLKVLEANKRFHPSRVEQLTAACVQIREQILKLGQTARDLSTNLDKNDQATVQVRGVVFPGTYIEICHTSHVVSRPVGPVCFRLDKTTNTIKAERL